MELGVAGQSESEFHERFRAYWIRGDWFCPGPSLVKFIESRFGRKINAQTNLPELTPQPALDEQARRSRLFRRAGSLIWPLTLMDDVDACDWVFNYELKFDTRHERDAAVRAINELIACEGFIGLSERRDGQPIALIRKPDTQVAAKWLLCDLVRVWDLYDQCWSPPDMFTAFLVPESGKRRLVTLNLTAVFECWLRPELLRHSDL